MGRTLLIVGALLAVSCTGTRSKLRVGETTALGSGEFYVSYTDARSAGTDVELLVYFHWTGPTGDVLKGFFAPTMKMTLLDREGNSYSPLRPSWSPIQPVPEEAYAIMRDYELYQESGGQDRSLEASMEVNASRLHRLEEDVKAGRNPIRWIQFFKVPSDSSGFSLIVENPDRQGKQPGTVEVSLGR